MNSKARLVVVMLAVSLALWMSPYPVAAQNATLYEVSETMGIKGGKMARRIAAATLSGTVQPGTPVCPQNTTNTPCSMTVIAFDNVDIATGKGPVNGMFAIVVQDTNVVDAPELVVFKGSLVGSVDLSPAFGGTPIGTITGTWAGGGTPGGPYAGLFRNGTFTGTFRMPFDYHGVPSYLTGSGGVPVANDEKALGWPTVKLELNIQ